MSKTRHTFMEIRILYNISDHAEDEQLMEFADKKVLVTGTSRGIGKAIAEAFLAKGALVAGVVRPSSALRQSIQHHNFIQVVCDLQDSAAVQALLSHLSDDWKDINVLVNNAGIKRRTNFADTASDVWDETITINLHTPYTLTRVVSNAMIARGNKGTIINIASQAGVGYVSSSLEYGISKAGLIYLTKASANVLAPYGITVNAISPGRTYTDLTAYTDDPIKEQEALTRIPLGHINTPEEIAKAVLFLASGSARNITGQVLAIDGGECVS